MFLGSAADLQAETPAPRSAALLAAATTPVKTFASEAPTKKVAGFRMEGAPHLETVFGDIASYKTRIDHFSALHARMTSERKRFATATHQVQVTLGPSKSPSRKRKTTRERLACPTDLIANNVATATDAHEQFRMLGVEFERSFLAIRDLHDLGESAGLTPDYRGRVLRSRKKYQQALGDLADMNAVIRLQLAPELAKRGCKTSELIKFANAQKESAKAAEEEVATIAPPTNITESTVVKARAVTFFVDNRTCLGDVNVFVDGKLLGHVAGTTHAAFQSLSGRHALCLLTEGGVAQCGDTGTVRTAFIHDGFRLQRSCEETK